MWPNPQLPADLVTFTEEILNGKLHFLCSATNYVNKGSFRLASHGQDNCKKYENSVSILALVEKTQQFFFLEAYIK